MKSFLKSTGCLTLIAALTVICTVFAAVWNGQNGVLLSDWSGSFCFLSLSSIFAVTVLVTYTRHDTNAMKPAIGMLLGINAYQALNAFVSNFVRADAIEAYTSAGASGYLSLVLDVLDFIMTVVFCVNHIMISSGHKSSKFTVTLNQALCAALSVEYVLQVILCIRIFSATRLVYLAVFYIAALCDIALILWVESKLNYFRFLREKETAPES